MIRIDELLMKLHRLIEAKRLTQEKLGKILGVDQSGVSRRLSGKTRLKIEEINKLSGLLDQLEAPASAGSPCTDPGLALLGQARQYVSEQDWKETLFVSCVILEGKLPEPHKSSICIPMRVLAGAQVL
jgi:transcriptional regulator with XRE-family HTH domain